MNTSSKQILPSGSTSIGTRQSEGETVIVIPCYNECERLPVDSFKEYSLQGGTCRFLFVDDGSTDSTTVMLQTLCSFDDVTFRSIRLPANVGKAEAVRQGFLAALSEQAAFIGYWDADLATPLDALSDFCTTLTQFPDLEMVMGARVILLGHQIDRRLLRHYIGRISATAASIAAGVRIYDAMCGAKCFRVTQRTISLFSRPFLDRWVFDVEVIARFANELRVRTTRELSTVACEQPLREWQEIRGSKVRWRDFALAAIALVKIFICYRCGIGRRPSIDPSFEPFLGDPENAPIPSLRSKKQATLVAGRR